MSLDRSEISQQLKSFLEQRFPHQEIALDGSTNLLDDWFGDSLGLMEAVLFLENNFGVELTRADITAENFKSLDTLTSFVLKKGVAGAAAS